MTALPILFSLTFRFYPVTLLLLIINLSMVLPCGGCSNENGSCGLKGFNAWSATGELTWERLGGVALLKEVCH